VPIYTFKQKSLFLRHAQCKVTAILKAEGPDILRAEGHACAYALGLYEVAAITQGDYHKLLAEARHTAEARAYEFDVGDKHKQSGPTAGLSKHRPIHGHLVWHQGLRSG